MKGKYEMEHPLIRLHYIWFKKYGCYQNQGINLSNEYSAQVEHPEPLKLNSRVARNEHLRR